MDLPDWAYVALAPLIPAAVQLALAWMRRRTRELESDIRREHRDELTDEKDTP